MIWIYKILKNYLRPKNSIDFNTIDYANMSFDQLNKVLISLGAEITFKNEIIIAEWASESQFLKIEYSKEGNFQRLIHLKNKK